LHTMLAHIRRTLCNTLVVLYICLYVTPATSLPRFKPSPKQPPPPILGCSCLHQISCLHTACQAIKTTHSSSCLLPVPFATLLGLQGTPVMSLPHFELSPKQPPPPTAADPTASHTSTQHTQHGSSSSSTRLAPQQPTLAAAVAQQHHMQHSNRT
jgi:hypothetical protein